MSANATQDPPTASSKSKKNKKKKSKAAAASKDSSDAAEQVNGHANAAEEDEDEDDGPATPADEGAAVEKDTSSSEAPAKSNGAGSVDGYTGQRLEAAAKERDDLRKQVTELRKELEQIQKRHDEETASIKTELEETQSGKEHAESRYQKLLGQVNTIKTQLGERLKSDAAELAQAREHIEGLEEQKSEAARQNESLKAEMEKLKSQNSQHADELSGLRGRTNLSQQNWAKERDDLVRREAQAREEFETARQAMHDWEVLAMEEKSVREGLSDRVAELEEQLSSEQETSEKAVAERDSQSQTIDGLQRALQEIHEARKQERRELVETSQKQVDELKRFLQAAEESSSTAQTELESTKKELERALPFEKEVKEKNLLIGKLRHEAVILNDHLTKALRFLRRGKPEDNVDRQLVTNHFMQFLALDRSDPKKFQVLQLISALLGWTEEQNEAAGLSRPGASTSTNIRVPLSGPFRRVSSTATLNPISSPTTPFTPDLSAQRGGSESLAELWSEFLEREAENGSIKGNKKNSRPSSVASTPMRESTSGIASPPPSTPQLHRQTSTLSIKEEAEE